MKKKIALLVCVTLLILTACGQADTNKAAENSSTTENSSTAENTSTEVTAETTEENTETDEYYNENITARKDLVIKDGGEIYNQDGYSVTATDCEYIDEDGYDYLLLTLKIVNNHEVKHSEYYEDHKPEGEKDSYTELYVSNAKVSGGLDGGGGVSMISKGEEDTMQLKLELWSSRTGVSLIGNTTIEILYFVADNEYCNSGSGDCPQPVDLDAGLELITSYITVTGE